VRWTPLHPRQATAIALTALMLLLVLMLATAPSAGPLDLSLGSGPGAALDAGGASGGGPAGTRADPLAPALRALELASPLPRGAA
jgi:hypothetical protein